ncbi:MAG: metallophosphoesterase [Gammaproteobacteria bacterium]|nr:metallophosphoesterase [Gammaproteobacteria bacterium]MDH3430864.1 metallophosphoesterase [Gammaproteobacteria bacterium]MDH3432330.1 metallophosphoesterase [Gammaproteobacteria bacterium]
MHKQVITVALALVTIVAFAMPAAAEEWRFDDVERVVAIADVHGAYTPMVKALKRAQVLDAGLAWSGGGAHLVIVGDLLDRGPDSRKAMDLLMRLEDEAAAAGGKVHVLIGNHEAMNLVGDLRYVSKGEYAAFADEELAEDRERWFAAYAEHRASGKDSPEGLRVRFEQRYPRGFFAHRRAFSSDGKYGKWLLTKPIVVVVNGTAFVHGGLSPMIAEIGLDGVNNKLQGEMAEYVRQLEVLFEAEALLPMDNFRDHPALLDEFKPSAQFTPPAEVQARIQSAIEAVKTLNESDLHSLQGPLWYRGNVVCSELVEEDKLDSVLQAIDATRVVIGHTPTPGRRVLERIDGKIIEIDTGMLSQYYGGSANVLSIDQSGVMVINQNRPEPVTPEPHPRRVGSRPVGTLTAHEIEVLLTTGEIDPDGPTQSGRDVVSVSDGTRSVSAVFTKRAARGFYPDVAAYRLDRLLELEMVPVAVVRELDGKDGSLQFEPENRINEFERQQQGSGGSAWCPLAEQWNAMFVFDALIYNEGRNGRNILYSLDLWQLMLNTHGKAFSTHKGVPRRLRDVPYHVGEAWKDALFALNNEVLQQVLGDVLDQKRLKALGARRDELLNSN